MHFPLFVVSSFIGLQMSLYIVSFPVSQPVYEFYVNLSLFSEIKITPENSFRVLLLLSLEATQIKIRIFDANKVLAAENLLCEHKFMH